MANNLSGAIDAYLLEVELSFRRIYARISHVCRACGTTLFDRARASKRASLNVPTAPD